MATVAPQAAAKGAFAGAQGGLVRSSPSSGATVQAPLARRPISPIRQRFTEIIRTLATRDWVTVAPNIKQIWKDPFGPAAWSRDGGLSGQRHGWRHFVMAHAAAHYYQHEYFPSNPSAMPNTLLITALDNIDWTARTATISLEIHWYNPPETCQAAEIYQVSPWRLTAKRPFHWTRRIATFTAFVTGQNDYQVPITWSFPIRPGQRLWLYVRLRTAGGHALGEDTSIIKP